MNRSLSHLLKGLEKIERYQFQDFEVSGLALDNRKINSSNYLFAAIKGEVVDGHQFIDEAIKNGAKVILCESLPENLIEEVVYLTSLDVPKTLGQIADNFYGHQTEKLVEVIGVTGTNGKTTVSTLLHQLFTIAGYKCGLISTVEIIIGSKSLPNTHTTPDVLTLHSLINQMVEEDCEYIFMEVSSHSVVQKRIAGIHFKAGLFTNLTHDHLDYHKTFDNYRDAKKGFFDLLEMDAFAISNADDKNGKYMLQNSRASRLYYSLENYSDFKGKILEYDLNGMDLQVNDDVFTSKLSGEFNAYNLTLVYATASMLDIDKEELPIYMSQLSPPLGRFTTLVAKNGITSIVDYAHTPDALKNILESIEKVNVMGKKIFTVIGCGGNRDKDKRPLMAKIAGEHSYKVILTSDNPRNEVAEDIIKDMERGITASRKHDFLSVTDRGQAIAVALQMASPGDIVLIAGKGHEKYQEINGVKTHFDDIEQVLNYYQQIN